MRRRRTSVKISGECNNMIGYEMGSSLVGYEMDKTSLVEGFKHGWRNGMGVNMAMFFCWGGLRRPSVLSNLKPSYNKFGLPKTPTWVFLFFFNWKKGFLFFFAIPTVASNNFVLGLNYWLIDALLYCRANRPEICDLVGPIKFIINPHLHCLWYIVSCTLLANSLILANDLN